MKRVLMCSGREQYVAICMCLLQSQEALACVLVFVVVLGCYSVLHDADTYIFFLTYWR